MRWMLDPADATNDFRIVSIEMVDGKPKLEWEPKTNHWTGARTARVFDAYVGWLVSWLVS